MNYIVVDMERNYSVSYAETVNHQGAALPDVFDEFYGWYRADFVFLIWGTEDLSLLRKNMRLHNTIDSFSPLLV